MRPQSSLDEKTLRQLINKRITMNALTQGAAVHQMMTAHHLVAAELNKIDPRLMELYSKFAVGSAYMYWYFDMLVALHNSEFNPGDSQVGSVKISYENDQDGQEEDEEGSQPMPTVVAKAFCFPVLLQEMSKGAMELLTLWGLEGIPEQDLHAIYSQADKTSDEVLLIQVGPELWRRFLKALPTEARGTKMASVIALMSKMESGPFEDLVDDLIARPDSAQQKLAELNAQEEEETDDAFVGDDDDEDDDDLDDDFDDGDDDFDDDDDDFGDDDDDEDEEEDDFS
jgi:hypothetical protein